MAKCYNNITIYKNLDRNIYPEGITVDCGHCVNCLNNRAKEKALRFIHEKEEYQNADFITFTLDDDRMSDNHRTKTRRTTVNKDFIRKYRNKIYARLYRWGRKSNKKYTDYKYIIGAEYGENRTERAHYHIVLLTNKYRSKILHQWLSNWKEGNVKLEANATIKSIYYTAGYVSKKIGQIAKYEECENPFLIMSKGLGKNWAIKNENSIFVNHCIYMSGDKGTYKHKVPKYYIDKLRELDIWSEEKYNEYITEGKKRAEESKTKELYEAVGEWFYKATGKIFQKIWRGSKGRIIRYKNDRMIEFYDVNGLYYNNLYERWKYKVNKQRKMEAIEKLKQKNMRRGQLKGLVSTEMSNMRKAGILFPI